MPSRSKSPTVRIKAAADETGRCLERPCPLADQEGHALAVGNRKIRDSVMVEVSDR
jgi:hypothetical protein